MIDFMWLMRFVFKVLYEQCDIARWDGNTTTPEAVEVWRHDKISLI